MSQNQSGGEKKGGSGGLLIALIAMVVMMLMYQNLNSDKTPGVAFKHQLEHLVNLDLLKKDDNRISPSSENLVTFSGRFKEQLTPASRNNYRFLELLSERNRLLPEKEALEENLPSLKESAKESSELFLALIGVVPQGGLDVIHPVFDSKSYKHSIVVDNADVENFK